MRRVTIIAASLALLVPTAAMASPPQGWGEHHRQERKAVRHERKADYHSRRAQAHARAADRHERRARRALNPGPGYGRVLSVEPVYARHAYSRENSCLQWRESERPRKWAPTVLGGVIGTAVGYKLGDGHRDGELAAIAGGLLGASIGHGVGRQAAETRSLHVRGPCTPRGREHHDVEPVEYSVRYRYNGRIYEERMDYAPGDWVALNVEVFPGAS